MTGTVRRRSPATAAAGRRSWWSAAGSPASFALRALQRRLPPETADLVLVNPTDYLLYSPLLPEVATGVVEARHIAVSLRLSAAPGAARARPGERRRPGARTVSVQGSAPGAPSAMTLSWDRLVLTPGSVTRQLPIPGVAEHGRGLKTLVEAVFLRDHLLAQLDLADAQPDTPAGRAERTALLTVVAWAPATPGPSSSPRPSDGCAPSSAAGAGPVPTMRWVLVDAAPMVLPGSVPTWAAGRWPCSAGAGWT